MGLGMGRYRRFYLILNTHIMPQLDFTGCAPQILWTFIAFIIYHIYVHQYIYPRLTAAAWTKRQVKHIVVNKLVATKI